MPELADFKVLTFDCYGTLIDWETGIWNALQPLLSAGGRVIGREEALAAFARRETEQELQTPSLLYSSLLSVTHARLAQDWGIAAHADHRHATALQALERTRAIQPFDAGEALFDLFVHRAILTCSCQRPKHAGVERTVARRERPTPRSGRRAS